MTGDGNLLERIVLACRILEMEGHGDMTLGHVSARDPGGRGFWLKRNAIGLGEVCSPADLVLLDVEEGAVLDGTGGRHSEWHIHAAIYRARPDVAAVSHTHPRAVCLLSALDTELAAATIESNYFHLPIPRFVDSAVLIKTRALGEGLAQALGPEAVAVVMANHGVTFCGASVEAMTMHGIWLEAACRAHLALTTSGAPVRIPPDPDLAERRAQILTPVHVAHSWDYLARKLKTRHGDRPFYGG